MIRLFAPLSLVVKYCMKQRKGAVPHVLIAEWCEKATEDALSLHAILKSKDGAPATCCFLAQQMAEKLLKALLLAFTGNTPKIHDLNKLRRQLEQHIPSVAQLKKECAILNRYYITARYPADIPEGFSWKDAQEAADAAERFEYFVLKQLERIR